MNLMILFLLLFALALANTVVAAVQVRGFLGRNTSIASRQILEDFKRMARWQMYQALFQVVFLVAACVLGVVGIITGRLSLLLVIAVNGAILVISKALQGAEKRARSLPAADEQLADEYRGVCETWVKKPFPDF